MWISQAAYLKDREDAITLRVERDVANQRALAQELTINWFMARLTQVEQERSRLIYNFTGVKVDAPTYEKASETSPVLENPLNSLPNFNDVGDLAAAAQGIEWNTDGELVYGKQ